MSNAHRYLVFGILDLLLAAFLGYRYVVPLVNGIVPFSPIIGIAIVLIIAFVGMGIWYLLRAKKLWGKYPG